MLRRGFTPRCCYADALIFSDADTLPCIAAITIFSDDDTVSLMLYYAHAATFRRCRAIRHADMAYDSAMVRTFRLFLPPAFLLSLRFADAMPFFAIATMLMSFSMPLIHFLPLPLFSPPYSFFIISPPCHAADLFLLIFRQRQPPMITPPLPPEQRSAATPPA